MTPLVLIPTSCPSSLSVDGRRVDCEKEPGHVADGSTVFAYHVGATPPPDPVRAAWTDHCPRFVVSAPATDDAHKQLDLTSPADLAASGLVPSEGSSAGRRGVVLVVDNTSDDGGRE